MSHVAGLVSAEISLHSRSLGSFPTELSPEGAGFFFPSSRASISLNLPVSVSLSIRLSLSPCLSFSLCLSVSLPLSLFKFQSNPLKG